MHGLGSSPDEFESFFYDYKIINNDFKVILPAAPKEPVTINGGMYFRSWFDILDLNGNPDSINYDDIIKNNQHIHNII